MKGNQSPFSKPDDPDYLLDPLSESPNMTLAEAARALGRSPETIRRRILSGKIPDAFREEDGSWMIRRKAFLHYFHGLFLQPKRPRKRRSKKEAAANG